MRGPNFPGFPRLSALSTTAFLAIVLLLNAMPCHGARAHARAHRRHHSSAGLRRSVIHSQHSGSRYASYRSRRERRRREALETNYTTPRVELARLPLEHFRMLSPLRGSRESLLRQNERADREDLTRIEDSRTLAAMSQDKELVALPVTVGLRVDPRLQPSLRYCRPWTARFLLDLAQRHYARFHTSLQVNSAVRTVTYQKHLLLINGNAAPAVGDTRSPHLTGEAVDIGKKGLPASEISWMRAYLFALQAAGKLDVEEEFAQACFHISVYRSYMPANRTQPPVHANPLPHPKQRHRATALLAARLR